jgi:hypothetical protein
VFNEATTNECRAGWIAAAAGECRPSNHGGEGWLATNERQAGWWRRASAEGRQWASDGRAGGGRAGWMVVTGERRPGEHQGVADERRAVECQVAATRRTELPLRDTLKRESTVI